MKQKKYFIKNGARYWSGTGWSPARENAKLLTNTDACTKRDRMVGDGIPARVMRIKTESER